VSLPLRLGPDLSLTFLIALLRRQLYWFRSRAPVMNDPAFQKVRLLFLYTLSLFLLTRFDIFDFTVCSSLRFRVRRW